MCGTYILLIRGLLFRIYFLNAISVPDGGCDLCCANHLNNIRHASCNMLCSVQKEADRIRIHLYEQREGLKRELVDAGIAEADNDPFLDAFRAETESRIIEQFRKKVLEPARRAT